jgi:hypothetical protein
LIILSETENIQKNVKLWFEILCFLLLWYSQYAFHPHSFNQARLLAIHLDLIKVEHVHTMKTYRGSGGIAPLIRNFSTRWRGVVTFTHWHLYPQLPWMFWRRENITYPTLIQNPDHPARSIVTIPNMLTKLLLLFHFFHAQNISTPFQHTFFFYVAVSVLQWVCDDLNWYFKFISFSFITWKSLKRNPANPKIWFLSTP